MRTRLLTSLAVACSFAAPAVAQSPAIGLGACSKHWAEAVVSASGIDDPIAHPATDALGDTPNTFTVLEAGGCLVVTFGGSFTQDGTPFSDIGVDEFGTSDCYELALRPSNNATIAAIVQDGWVPVGGGFYTPANLVECGDQNWDIDFYAPGNAGGTLSFDALRLCNLVGLGGDVEIARAWANLVCPCVGPVATSESRPCGFGPLDPVLTSDPFTVLTTPKVYLDSQFPQVPGWIYWSAVPAQSFNVNGCTFWIDLFSLNILDQFLTDVNGDHVAQVPLLSPSLAGIQLSLLARVCSPNFQTQGPLAPLPDFFSNTLIVRIGCPPTAGL